MKQRSLAAVVTATVTSLALVRPLCAAGYTPPWVPTGVNPGDTYHLVFVTSTTRDATSGDIGVYDSFVDDRGDTLLGSPYGDITWLCIGSTSAADAITHAPISGPVYRLDGVKVADDSSDLWDSSIDNPINVDDAGNTGIGDVVASGTSWNGMKDSSMTLGSSSISGGHTGITIGGGWVNGAYAAPSSTPSRFYSVSESLTAVAVVPEPGTISLAVLSLAVGGAALRRRRRKAAAPK